MSVDDIEAIKMPKGTYARGDDGTGRIGSLRLTRPRVVAQS